MKWLLTKNNELVNLKKIPVFDISILREQTIIECKNGKRAIGFFGKKENNEIILYVILADDEDSNLLISSSIFKKEKSYLAFSRDIVSFNLFEREFYEDFGIVPLEHPWLKPIRYSCNRINRADDLNNYPFYSIDNKEIHEVGVGPVHAGIIEPGHFRFLCHGEKVLNLEIQLGYQHRGVERLFLENNDKIENKIYLAESIAGDSVIAHAGAFAHAIEALGNIEITYKAVIIRSIALELERIGNHLGDLSALSNDIAYITGNAAFGAMRTEIINTSLLICGNRFGRGLIRVGGCNFNINKEIVKEIKEKIKKISKVAKLAGEVLFSSTTVLSRFEDTGIVKYEDAKSIGMVGPSARASGIAIDVRADHPYGIFKKNLFHKITLKKGDVFARAYMRYIEIQQSLKIIDAKLNKLSGDNIFNKSRPLLKSENMVVSMVEGWRGEVVHIAQTDKKNKVSQYKIKDPSFNNWSGLELAVRNNEISDFPLCNKSFNLSYCGFDL